VLSILKSLAQKEIAIAMAPAPCVDCLVLWLAENRRAREALEVSTVECVLPACSSLLYVMGISVLYCLSFFPLSIALSMQKPLSLSLLSCLSLSFSLILMHVLSLLLLYYFASLTLLSHFSPLFSPSLFLSRPHPTPHTHPICPHRSTKLI
jgi:hypothetical protein